MDKNRVRDEIDFLMEMEFRLQQDLSAVQRKLGELLSEREVELGEEVHALRRARFTVIHSPTPDGA